MSEPGCPAKDRADTTGRTFGPVVFGAHARTVAPPSQACLGAPAAARGRGARLDILGEAVRAHVVFPLLPRPATPKQRRLREGGRKREGAQRVLARPVPRAPLGAESWTTRPLHGAGRAQLRHRRRPAVLPDADEAVAGVPEQGRGSSTRAGGADSPLVRPSAPATDRTDTRTARNGSGATARGRQPTDRETRLVDSTKADPLKAGCLLGENHRGFRHLVQGHGGEAVWMHGPEEEAVHLHLQQAVPSKWEGGRQGEDGTRREKR